VPGKLVTQKPRQSTGSGRYFAPPLGTPLAYSVLELLPGVFTMQKIDSNLYRFILESLPVAVFAVDHEGKILFWNEGAEKITGHLRQDILGRNCRDGFIEHADEANNPLQGDAILLMETLREGRSQNTRASIRTREGHFVAVKVQTLPFRDEQDVVQGAVEIFEEAVPAVANNRRTSKLAALGRLDMATGVLNRLMIEARLSESLSLYKKQPVPLCIVCAALDDLEKIRARFGQAAVEEALRTAAQTLQSGLRPTDCVGRWSDVELLAILNECAESEIMNVGERLRKLVHHTGINWWGDSVHLTISVGATCAHDLDSVDSIVARAEQALKESSVPPGNCVVVVNKE
jgi:diguanylate cyclase (GGDEF)-like protein/PAS domain S-box-containing protein